MNPDNIRKQAVDMTAYRVQSVVDKLITTDTFRNRLLLHWKQMLDVMQAEQKLIEENPSAYEKMFKTALQVAEEHAEAAGSMTIDYIDIAKAVASIYEDDNLAYAELQNQAGLLWMSHFDSYVAACQRFDHTDEILFLDNPTEAYVVSLVLKAGPNNGYIAKSIEEAKLFSIELMQELCETKWDKVDTTTKPADGAILPEAHRHKEF